MRVEHPLYPLVGVFNRLRLARNHRTIEACPAIVAVNPLGFVFVPALEAQKLRLFWLGVSSGRGHAADSVFDLPPSAVFGLSLAVSPLFLVPPDFSLLPPDSDP